jgi:hypothetical protein
MVTVAATGAGLALPLLGTGAAHAADAGTWDKVAVCETGGLWSADTGNGFYGGLAITQDTWDVYGGKRYAKRPDLASRSQQIAVAEKILADIGPQAWPGCETDTGLVKDTGLPDVDPGDPATPAPRPSTPGHHGPAGTPVPTAPGTSAPGTDAGTTPVTPTLPPVPGTPTLPAVPTTGIPSAPGTDPGDYLGTYPGTDPSALPVTPGGPLATTPVPGASAPSAQGTGKHAKPYSPTDEELAAADRATRTQVYSVTGTDDPTAGTGGANRKGDSGTSIISTTSDHGAYSVGEGDSLSGIAAAQGIDGGWLGLYDANQQVIGDDPNLIKPGQILNLG